jgi:murein DD-endopeptidase MepM/ murein hydrolase activator NlpD
VDRPSPRTAASRSDSSGRRRVSRTLAILCTLAVAAGPAAPLAHADNLHDKKKKVQASIKSVSNDFDDASTALVKATHRLDAARASLAVAQQQLAATQGELTAAQVLDAQMQAELAAAEAALAQAEQDVTNGEAAVKQQRADIGRLAAADFQYGDPSLMGLSVMLNSQDPEDLTTQMNTVDNLMSRESNMLDRLKATQALLVVQKEKVAKAKADVAEQRRLAAANLVRRQQLEQQAAANQAAVAQQVAARAQAAAAARQIRLHDLLVLQQLKKREARIQKAILAKAAHDKGGYAGDTGGFLYRPVPGAVTSPFGWRRHPIYGYWGLHDGVDFSAPCGEPMHAGASGTVISEYYSSVWGNRLYLDAGRVNGKSMVLIYNHASAYKAHTGDHVGRGDVVAYAGTTGWSTGCHLHFTVMLDGSPVDPAPYL